MDYWSVISYCPDLLRFLFAFQFLGNIRSGQILYLASRAEQSGNKSWLAADKKHGTSLALLEPRSTSPNHRSSPKDDFSLEPTGPSTWLIAETDSLQDRDKKFLFSDWNNFVRIQSSLQTQNFWAVLTQLVFALTVRLFPCSDLNYLKRTRVGTAVKRGQAALIQRRAR